MPTIDGIQRSRGAPPRARRTALEPLPPTPKRRIGSNAGGLFILLGLTALGLLALRPAATPPTTPATPAETVPSSAIDTPSTALTLPRATADTPLDNLIVLDQPTETSTPQATEELGGEAKPARTFRVRILNGGGAAGAAATLKATLERAAYTVTTVGNARSTYATTTIYYANDFLAEATELAASLGSPTPAVEANDIAAPADILVVLGADRS